MDAIVLVKYVADVEDIPPDAWDLDTGTLRRGHLRMVANPLDDRALAAARALATGEHDRVVVISMGPRSAERVCRRAIAYGADEAVLLTDSAFAGADTLATARTLALAVERAISSFGLTDPVILAGMQSPDGDTAQVPAELAAVSGLPLLPYASSLRRLDHGIEVETVLRRGRRRVSLRSLPAVVTLTPLAAALPFHASLSAFRTAATADVTRWRGSDLGLPADATGLAGSATRVTRIETVAHDRSATTRLVLEEADDPAAAVAEVVDALAAGLEGDGAGRPNTRATPAVDDGGGSVADEPRGRRAGAPIFVLAERTGDAVDALDEGSLELLGEARVLGDALGVDAVALVCGVAPSAATVETLASHGATAVLAALPAAGVSQAIDHHTTAALVAAAALAHRPRTVLVPASLEGRTVSALAAALLGAGLTADCTGLELEPPAIVQVRPALGGNVLAWIVSTVRDRGLPEMATVRSGVFAPRRFAAGRIPVDVERPDLSGFADRLPPEGWCSDAGPDAADAGVGGGTLAGGDAPADDASRGRAAGVDVDADVIVAVGAGIGEAEAVDRLVEPLRTALAERFGVTASLACSRAAVEAGILPYEYQIGQTGKSVRPRLYIALGVSGAIQHRLGMEHSARILSVNPDPDASIHAVSDYAIVATAEDALPLLLRSLETRRKE